jgi:hypothetical protein
MKSKSYAILVLLLLSTMTFSPSVKADELPLNPQPRTEELSEAEIQTRLAQMRARVAEIRSMDKSGLTKAERKALRNELKEMNQQARSWGSGGVYLSVGAIIVIILLLILIL